MKFKYLLLLVFSVWLVGITTSMAAPIRAVNRLTATRFVPDADTAQTYRNCQTISAAVVTVYAGNETGSGSIVSPEGLVLTSNHVLNDRTGQSIVAQTAAGERYQGRVVKIDARNDLALLQLEAQKRFPIVPLATVSQMQPGQSVCAIGSPYGRPGVLSEGTLSLVKGNGDLQAAIRLYPGNSGGPLLNAQGEMIGVNKAILESPSGSNTGISFATSVQAVRTMLGSSVVTVPVGAARTALKQPLAIAQSVPTTAVPTTAEWTWAMPNAAVPSVEPATPQANRSSRRLGLTIDVRNLVIQQVQAGSAAANSGFRSGDRLIAVNGQKIGGFTALQAFLARQPAAANFTIARGQQLSKVQVRF